MEVIISMYLESRTIEYPNLVDDEVLEVFQMFCCSGLMFNVEREGRVHPIFAPLPLYDAIMDFVHMLRHSRVVRKKLESSLFLPREFYALMTELCPITRDIATTNKVYHLAPFTTSFEVARELEKARNLICPSLLAGRDPIETVPMYGRLLELPHVSLLESLAVDLKMAMVNGIAIDKDQVIRYQTQFQRSLNVFLPFNVILRVGHYLPDGYEFKLAVTAEEPMILRASTLYKEKAPAFARMVLDEGYYKPIVSPASPLQYTITEVPYYNHFVSMGDVILRANLARRKAERPSIKTVSFLDGYLESVTYKSLAMDTVTCGLDAVLPSLSAVLDQPILIPLDVVEPILTDSKIVNTCLRCAKVDCDCGADSRSETILSDRISMAVGEASNNIFASPLAAEVLIVKEAMAANPDEAIACDPSVDGDPRLSDMFFYQDGDIVPATIPVPGERGGGVFLRQMVQPPQLSLQMPWDQPVPGFTALGGFLTKKGLLKKKGVRCPPPLVPSFLAVDANRDTLMASKPLFSTALFLEALLAVSYHPAVHAEIDDYVPRSEMGRTRNFMKMAEIFRHLDRYAQAMPTPIDYLEPFYQPGGFFRAVKDYLVSKKTKIRSVLCSVPLSTVSSDRADAREDFSRVPFVHVVSTGLKIDVPFIGKHILMGRRQQTNFLVFSPPTGFDNDNYRDYMKSHYQRSQVGLSVVHACPSNDHGLVGDCLYTQQHLLYSLELMPGILLVGGIFVLRVPNTFARTNVGLLFDLALHFQQFHLLRLANSNPSSMEVYFVGVHRLERQQNLDRASFYKMVKRFNDRLLVSVIEHYSLLLRSDKYRLGSNNVRMPTMALLSSVRKDPKLRIEARRKGNRYLIYMKGGTLFDKFEEDT